MLTIRWGLCIFLALATDYFAELSAEASPSTSLRDTVSRALGFVPRSAWTDLFDKIAEDVRCEDTKIFKGVVGSAHACVEKCMSDDRCGFYAVWSRSKYCETYATCFYKSADGKKSITLYKRSSECDVELKRGRGLVEMEKSFPGGVVSRGKNMYCVCTTRSWMMCGVFLRPDSPEEKLVLERLDPQDEEKLEPFYAIPSVSETDLMPIAYDIEASDMDGQYTVYVEIEVTSPQLCLNMNMCANDKCPITNYPFLSGEAVFVLSEDYSNVERGIPVPCISINGLRTRSMNPHTLEKQGILDPFGRHPDELIQERPGYFIIFIFNEEQLSSGICPSLTSPKKKKSSRGGKKKKKGATFTEAEDEYNPLIAEGGPSSEPELTSEDQQALQTVVKSDELTSPDEAMPSTDVVSRTSEADEDQEEANPGPSSASGSRLDRLQKRQQWLKDRRRRQRKKGPPSENSESPVEPFVSDHVLPPEASDPSEQLMSPGSAQQLPSRRKGIQSPAAFDVTRVLPSDMSHPANQLESPPLPDRLPIRKSEQPAPSTSTYLQEKERKREQKKAWRNKHNPPPKSFLESSGSSESSPKHAEDLQPSPESKNLIPIGSSVVVRNFGEKLDGEEGVVESCETVCVRINGELIRIPVHNLVIVRQPEEHLSANVQSGKGFTNFYIILFILIILTYFKSSHKSSSENFYMELET